MDSNINNKVTNDLEELLECPFKSEYREKLLESDNFTNINFNCLVKLINLYNNSQWHDYKMIKKIYLIILRTEESWILDILHHHYLTINHFF